MSSNIQLTIEEPKPTDIFRVYRANHPETLTFDAPSRVAKSNPSLAPKPSITLTDPDNSNWGPVSTVPLLTGPAAVSAATRQINLVCDVNEMLAANNFDAAENLLGRKLTDEEKQSKLMADKWAPLQERATRSAEFDDMKETARLSRKRYAASLEKYAAARTAAAKAAALKNAARFRAKAAADLEELIDAVVAARQDEEATWAAFGRLFDTDDDAAGAITSDMGGELEELPEGSIAPTVVRDGEEKEHLRDDDDVRSVASTEIDAKTRGTSGLWVFPWTNKPEKPKKDDWKKRADDLQDKYPTLSSILKGYKSAKKDELEVMVTQAEDELARKAAEAAGKKQAKNEVEAEKHAERNQEELSLTGNGMQSPFTGLRKMKNHMDYVPFGRRFLIDLKRLKDKSEFSLAYPKSGQKPNLIRNAILTPALKDVVLAYIEGQPQDTTDLDEKEMAWLKLVWQQTGLQKSKPKLKTAPKRYQGKADLKGRLKVLMGQCLAGNDNPEVLTEMGGIVDQLEERKWISEKDIINSRRFISGE